MDLDAHPDGGLGLSRPDGGLELSAKARKVIPALAAAFCACFLVAFTLADAASAYTASLTRTTGGVANIEAATLGDAGFATGYAQAEDGICTLASAYLTVDGERSRFLGPTAKVVYQVGSISQTNLASDFYWTAIKDNHTVESLLEKPFPQGPSAAAKELVAGYAAGYDKYLEDVGGPAGITDPRCAGESWVRPISSIEVWRRVYQLATIEGGAPRAELIVDAQPPEGAPLVLGDSRSAPSTSAIAARAAKVASNLAQLTSNVGTPRAGSNGLGIGSEDTTNGDGVVLANPHFPWVGDTRFWESHVDVPGVYDAIGASLWGSPLVLIGHNQHLAWTHTVSTNVTSTLWRLELVPGHSTQYELDGKPVPMSTQNVTVEALEHGVLVPKSHTFYSTRFGPLLGVLAPWNTSEAYAFDDANADNLRVIDQWLAIGQAESAQGVIEAEQKIEGVPWVNTIGADDKGNAFYSEIAVTPYVTSEQTKNVFEGGCDLKGNSPEGPFVGSVSACELPNNPGSATGGRIYAGNEAPSVVRKDYVENSNNSFWLANASKPLTGYPRAFGGEDENPGMRAQTGIDMVNQRIGAGNGGVPTDGISLTPGFTAQSLRDSWTSYRSLPADRALSGLREICHNAVNENAGIIPVEEGGKTVDVDVSAACPILDKYDGTAKLHSAGGWLFSEWWNNAESEENAAFWVVPWNAAEPVYTPNTLNTHLPSSGEALAKAIMALERRKIPLDASFGEVQHAPQLNTRIPIPGCYELDSCFASISSEYDGPTAGAATVSFGSSIVMFTELSPSGPVAEGLLTYSQSENVNSPFYEDQTIDFSENKWIKLPWTAAQVREDAIGPTLALSTAAPEGQQPPPSQTGGGGGSHSSEQPPNEQPPKKHKLTRAQKLKKALKQCAKKSSKAKRQACRKQARKKYGPRLTRAQKLKKALKQCAKKSSKAKRQACRKQAHKRYSPKKHHGTKAKRHGRK